ncbi:MAG: NYN domain-containing protein [Eubacteriales bacterium]
MINQNERDLCLAVLIDADNASRTAMKDVMAEVARYGTPTVKRIYGDWTAPNMNSWKQILLETAITPIQQYSYTSGKNATDSAMIIDAMDLLYSGKCDGFVLVSSDSDFTRLATRLREAGMKVYGMGELKTPQPFIVACDKFIYIEIIRAAAQKEAETKRPLKSAEQKSTKQPPRRKDEGGIPEELLDFIGVSIESICGEDGWAHMGRLGNLMLKKRPDFDARNYGFPKLSKLVEAAPRFQIRSMGESGTELYVTDTHIK